MRDLSVFQAPNDGEVTLCEVDGRVHSMNYEYANVSAFTAAVDNHPKIHITRDVLHPYSSGDEARALFLPVSEPFLKRLVQIYYEQGFTEVLHYASEHGPVFVRKTTSIVLDVIQRINNVGRFFNSNLCEDNLVLIDALSETRSWRQSPIRCIAWHTHYTKVAVAASDDGVRIYSNETNLVPLLKCKHQKNITCLAWHPLSNSELAVGCENGIFVWNIDPSSVVTRPSINNAIILYRLQHTPIVNVAWGVRGDILMSVAALDKTILVWNVELNETSSLKRPGCNGNSFLKWSPNGSKLFSATTGLTFRVWECQTWQAERWTLLNGRVQTGCWSPCGTIVLFATQTESLIYALSFVQSELIFATDSKNSPNQAVPVYDLTKVDIDGLIVGGIVRKIDWDPKGNYLAVLFNDTNYVAVFKVTIHPVLILSPSSLIAGTPEEYPVTIAFQRNFENGACLSVAWSSGRLQYFPITHSSMPSPSSVNSTSYTGSGFYRSLNAFKSPNLSIF